MEQKYRVTIKGDVNDGDYEINEEVMGEGWLEAFLEDLDEFTLFREVTKRSLDSFINFKKMELEEEGETTGFNLIELLPCDPYSYEPAHSLEEVVVTPMESAVTHYSYYSDYYKED